MMQPEETHAPHGAHYGLESEPMGLLERLRGALHGLATLVFLPAALVLWSAAALIHALLGATPRQAHRYYRGFARTCLAFGGTRVELHGLENAIYPYYEHA